MLSIQETIEKASAQLKTIESFMDSHGYYDPYQCNRLLYTGLKRSIQREVRETIRHLSLKEFLFNSANTGYGSASGNNYLIAPVLSSKIYQGMTARDRGAAIAADIIEEAKGETLNVATAMANAYESGEAGDVAPQGFIVNQSAITYKKWKYPLITSSDMMEDSGYALMDLAAQNRGMTLAQKTNDHILSVLKRTSGTTGFGDKPTETAGADTTTPAQVAATTQEVAAGDGTHVYHPNLLIISPEVLADAVSTTAGHPEILPPRSPQYDAWYDCLDLVRINSLQLGTVASNKLTNAVTIVMEKECGIVIARKQWLRIENYADPRNDLFGAVVTARQACGELVDSAIGVLTES